MPWPVLPINQHIRIAMQGSLAGQTIISTFAYRVLSVSGADKPVNDVAEGFFDATAWTNLVSAIAACVPEDLNYSKLSFQQVGATRLAAYKTTMDVDGLGEPCELANVAQVVTRRSFQGGRDGVGSLHLPVAQDPVTIGGGELSGAQFLLLQNVADKMLINVSFTVDGSAYVLRPIIISSANDSISLPLDQAFAQKSVRVMRRRNKGIGI